MILSETRIFARWSGDFAEISETFLLERPGAMIAIGKGLTKSAFFLEITNRSFWASLPAVTASCAIVVVVLMIMMTCGCLF